MKIRHIVALFGAIKELMALDKEKLIKLSGIAKIKIAYNFNVLAEHIESYQKARNSIIEELGEKSDDAEGSFTVKQSSPNFPAFKKHMMEIGELDRNVTLDILTKVDLFGEAIEAGNQNNIPIEILTVFLECNMMKHE